VDGDCSTCSSRPARAVSAGWLVGSLALRTLVPELLSGRPGGPAVAICCCTQRSCRGPENLPPAANWYSLGLPNLHLRRSGHVVPTPLTYSLGWPVLQVTGAWCEGGNGSDGARWYVGRLATPPAYVTPPHCRTLVDGQPGQESDDRPGALSKGARAVVSHLRVRRGVQAPATDESMGSPSLVNGANVGLRAKAWRGEIPRRELLRAKPPYTVVVGGEGGELDAAPTHTHRANWRGGLARRGDGGPPRQNSEGMGNLARRVGAVASIGVDRCAARSGARANHLRSDRPRGRLARALRLPAPAR